MQKHFSFLLTLAVSLLCGQCPLLAQGQLIKKEIHLDWTGTQQVPDVRTGQVYTRLGLKDAQYLAEQGGNPRLVTEWPGKYILSATPKVYALPLSRTEKRLLDTVAIATLQNTELVLLKYGTQARKTITLAIITPLRRNPATNRLERIVKLDLALIPQAAFSSVARQQDTGRYQAPLAAGNWGKVGILKTGVYKVDYNQLRSLGLPITSLNPRQLRVLGNGGAMLPEIAGEARPAGLTEVACRVVGEEDGRFDPGDYLLFYGQGTIQYSYNSTSQRFTHKPNLYTDTACYFIGLADNVSGKRITAAPSVQIAPAQTLTTFLDRVSDDRDLVNLLKSGRQWFSESFDFNLTKTLTFSAPGLVAGLPIKLAWQVGASSIGDGDRPGATTQFKFNLGGQQAGLSNLSGCYAGPFSTRAVVKQDGGEVAAPAGAEDISIGIVYNKGGNSQAVGYLDWVEATYWRQLTFGNGQLFFRNPAQAQLADSQSVAYSINQPTSAMQVWDVTNASGAASIQPQLTGGVATFTSPGGALREFASFDPDQATAPLSLGPIANQSLAEAGVPDLLIITAPGLESAAEQLASLRRRHDGLSVLVATTAQIFNEFSSGQKDLSGIRDYLRYLNKRGNLSYVVLMGDCSFDYKNRTSGNTDLIPVYETRAWSDPISSQATDDYIGMLDDLEGNFGLADKLDVAIGRLPVRSLVQAQDVVAKYARYSEDTATLGSWRQVTAFIADNHDRLTHLRDADDMADLVERLGPMYNVQKFYLSAYPIVAGPGGEASPDLKDALLRRIRSGAAVVNYSGHGSEFLWTDERIFDSETINALDNAYKLPLFITATCEFGKMDDPAITSGAEAMVLRPFGGAIGVISACRPVYQNSNAALNEDFIRGLFGDTANAQVRIGDAFVIAKSLRNRLNNIPYLLFGDPSQRLSTPKHRVVSTSLTDETGQRIDTIRALQTVTMSGIVRTTRGQFLDRFRGRLSVTLYDKATTVQVSEIDIERSGPYQSTGSFKQRRSIIFNGATRVQGGRWSITFQLPQDINYTYGSGKISFYAQPDQGLEDAAGFDTDSITIGGSVIAVPDTLPPIVRLYMNDTTFRDGGLVGPNPTFLARIQDDRGINVSLSGIGHEMVGTFSSAPREPVVMNEFFSTDLGRPSSGTVRYPLQNLAPGRYTVDFKGWDLQNNSATATLNFTVGAGGCPTLSRSSVVPNPVSANSLPSFRLELSEPGAATDVEIKVFDMLGRQCGTVSHRYQAAPATLQEGLEWSPGSLANGVYLYRVEAHTGTGCTARATGRLAINQ